MDTQYFIIYKTTNLINGKTYIGKHTTRNLDDSYLGSGVALKRAILKYGICMFSREIIFMAFSLVDLNWVEQYEFVTCDEVNNPFSYNMIVGGSGGFHDSELRRRCLEIKKMKYGDANYNNQPKSRATCLLRYGVEHSQQNSDVRKKSHATKVEKYGEDYMQRMIDIGCTTKVEKYGDVNFNNRQKAKATNVELYGVDNYSKTEKGKKLIRDRQLGHTRSVGELNGRAKTITIVSPEGTEYVCRGTFEVICETLGLSPITLRKQYRTGKPITRGPSAGWTIRYS